MLYLSLFVNFCLITYLGYTYIQKNKKSKYPAWVVEFYRQMNHGIQVNQEFQFECTGIDSKEWIAMYKGLRDHHNLPLGFIDLISKGKREFMIVKTGLYQGSRVKKLHIVMDYTPEDFQIAKELNLESKPEVKVEKLKAKFKIESLS